MLQLLAVKGSSAEKLEKTVARLAHKTHQLPSLEENGWSVKLFGALTPKANELESAAQQISTETNATVLLARGLPDGWSSWKIFSPKNVVLDMMHPSDWMDYANQDDAWEFCIEEFGDPAEGTEVAGIDPDDKLLAFLWDEDEGKKLEKNVIPNNEPGFCQRLVELFKRKGLRLPTKLETKILKTAKVDRAFAAMFAWQKKQFVAANKKAKIKFDARLVDQCFDIKTWESSWVDSLYGNFPGLLSAVGIDCLANWLNEEDEDDFCAALNAKKTFKAKKVSENDSFAWEQLTTRSPLHSIVEAAETMEWQPFDKPYSIATHQIGHLLQLTESLDKSIDWMLEVKLPRETFELKDGSTFDWSRLHSRDKRALEVIRIDHDGRKFVWATDGPQAFFPDPKGEAEFQENIARYNSGFPPEARVPLYQFLEALPDNTKLTLYTHSPYELLPITTSCFRGTIEDGKFQISDRHSAIPREDFEAGVEFFKAQRAERFNFRMAAINFKRQMEGTYWDAKPFQPKEFAREGSLQIMVEPENGPSPFRRIAVAVKKYNKDFQKLGFEYVGTLSVPKLGSVKLMCFTGPSDVDAHIVLELGSVRPEFWTRFESGDVLTTNTTEFFGASTNHPKSGLYFRTYYNRPLSKLLKKHRDGISRFEEHKNTQPIEHQPELEAFANNLIYYISRHPEFKVLTKV